MAVSVNGDTLWILPMNMERVKCFHDSEVPPFSGKIMLTNCRMDLHRRCHVYQIACAMVLVSNILN